MAPGWLPRTASTTPIVGVVLALLLLSGFATALPHPPAVRDASGSVSSTSHPAVRPAVSDPTFISLGNATTPIELAVDNATGDLLVSTGSGATDNGSVAIVDPTTPGLVGWISNFSDPSGIAYDGLTNDVYVSEFTPCCPSFEAVAPATPGAEVQYVALGAFNPGGVTVDPDNGYVYVSELNGGAITILNGTTEKVLGNLTDPTMFRGSVLQSVYDPANATLYVPVGGENRVTTIDTLTDSITGTLLLPNGTFAGRAALDPANGSLFVIDGTGCACAGNLTVVNTTTNQVSAEIPLPIDPSDIAYDGFNGDLYVLGSAPAGAQNSSAPSVVSIVNASSRTVVGGAGLAGPALEIVYDATDQNVYVPEPTEHGLAVLPSDLRTYPITVNEAGLPHGTIWQLTLTDGEAYRTSGTNLTFFEPNGSYAGSAASLGLEYVADVPPLVVSGAPLVVNLTFAPNPGTVTFSETGLPSHARWVVLLYRQVEANRSNVSVYDGSRNTTASAMTIPLPNGTYGFSLFAFAVNGTNYNPVPESGKFVLAGAPIEIPVAFVPQTMVVFQETGLDPSLTWTVTLNGSTQSSSFGGTISFLEGPGSYSFVVSPVAGYNATPRSGTVTVTDRSINVTISFTLPEYPVRFEEVGLPLGTAWSVATSGGEYNTTTTVDRALLPNGSYEFLVLPVPGFLGTPELGSITVDGALLVVPLRFQPVLYDVTFTETGLPAGTAWSVQVGSTTETASGDSITFSLPNGTYAYTASTSANFTGVPAGGSVVVLGASLDRAVTFRAIPTYRVTFSARGLGARNWSITFDERTLSSTGGPIVFGAPNGTYRFTVTAEGGLLVSPSQGAIQVNGGAVARQVNFTAAAPASSRVFGLPADEGYALVAGLTGLVVGSAVGVLLNHRRRPPPSAAGQTPPTGGPSA